ncbi:hypothetical protein [Proteiniclasticum sp. QWL-01]|uniref:hypothetical protein n=1 Tax=Proteiniclasticum sp. QWL-01 TaxID=3036945 RepID=UPI00241008AB|nr:hypothetical protein [Proteiniclasticum sp. QWL-01]WFF73031.1 hypothetical protein P6M73_00765 [Proteiniclasticum sp. QWL-01]
MKQLTRGQLMLKGVMVKGEPHLLKVGSDLYRVSDELAGRIRRKNILLGLETVTLTLLYRLRLRPLETTPFQGADPAFLNGLALTGLFLLSLIAAFALTGWLVLPRDLTGHARRVDA